MLKDYKKSSLKNNKKWPIAYILVFFFLILFLFSNNTLYKYSFGYLGSKISFFFETNSSSLSLLREKFFATQNLADLKMENEKLTNEIAKLKEEIINSGLIIKDENIINNFNLIEADVIGRENFFDTPIMLINKGQDQGIYSGMAVIDENGTMIGKIKENTPQTSYIILSLNIDSRITAVVSGTNYQGVLEGNKNLRAILEMLPIESKIDNESLVVSDNSDPNIPAGLLLGKVVEVKESDDRLFKEAVLDLPWDSKTIRKIWVVKGRK